MNAKLEKKFDEEFPTTQKEPTHFDGCICWSCNDKYREQVKSFIDKYFIAKKEVQETIKDAYKKFGVYTKRQFLDMVGKDKKHRSISAIIDEVLLAEVQGYNQRGKEIRERINDKN